MIKKLEKHIHSKFPFIKGKKILLGISGGLDSMVLGYLLKVLGFDLTLAHVNFNLRGKHSDEDESFVTQWSQSNNLPLFKTSFDTNRVSEERKISIEMAARDLRYDWFNKLIDDYNFDYIAVAHHLNDNIETVLMNLSRGTGISGLSGMKDVNGKIIRPLLETSRNEIEEFAVDIGLDWREDLTNADTVYKRNKIRHNLVPVFEQINPSFVESFLKTVSNLRQTELIQQTYLENVNYDFWKEIDDVVEIDIPKLTEIVAFETVLREKLKPYGFKNVEDVITGFSLESGKEYFSSTHRIVKDRNKLILAEIREEKDDVFYINGKTVQLIYPIHIQLKRFNKFIENTNVLLAQLDVEKLKFPLKLRKWEEGDFFFPQGMKGKKKLSKYFKDEKYSLVDKENQWLLLSDNKIIWVVGKRLDDRFKVTSSTKEILRVEVKI
ncbi:MAG: tRNA lysidine(34) synthetase TilS [Flavobacteriales bacterium]|nr:tRNA lysidine(34) synthetase TilS [Flavobacteriales bacterium]